MLSTVKRLLSRKIVWIPLVTVLFIMLVCGVINFAGTSLFPKGLPISAAPTLTPQATEPANTRSDTGYVDALTVQAVTPTPEVTTSSPTVNATATFNALIQNAAQNMIGQTATAEYWPTGTHIAGMATATAQANAMATQSVFETIVAAATQLATQNPTATVNPFVTPTFTPTITPTPSPLSIWISEDQNYQSLLSSVALVLPDAVVLHELNCTTFLDDVPYSLLPPPDLVVIDHRYGNEDVGPNCVEQLADRYPAVTYIVTSGADIAQMYENFDLNIIFIQTNKEDWSSLLEAVQQALGLAE